MMILFTLLWNLVIGATVLFHQPANADDGQFYGGSMKAEMKNLNDNLNQVTVELITGWRLGKGPCGPGCSKSDIGRSTGSTRPLMLQSDTSYLGDFKVEYRNETTWKTVIDDINSIVSNNSSETVIAVSENSKWEQELLHFKCNVKSDVMELDISFEGYSWRRLAPLQLNTSRVRWHFQTKLSGAIRSDTNMTNRSPKVLAKPFYRIKLDKVTEIQIPAIDEDDDFIKCYQSNFVEGGDISMHPPPHVSVNENCSIFINASKTNNYTDDTWIAVPVDVRDYNRKNIQYGDNPYFAASYSISTSALQFTVQVLANLITPEFVIPTHEGNHAFTLYANTTFRTILYAEATENSTISYFTAYGIQQENFSLSGLEQDQTRPLVRYSAVSWKPSSSEVGRHIVCTSATDDTGVDSAEQRCFTIEVKADAFYYTTQITLGKPYFVDIPAPDQVVTCRVKTTCVVAVYAKSTAAITEISVTRSFIDEYSFGPIQNVRHNGEQMYQVDLSFEHSHGKADICFIAKDEHGKESENECIQIQSEPLDPCMSAPCSNSATCDFIKDTGGFRCLCLPNYTGKTCSERYDPCTPDPCVPGHSLGCLNINNILCYCKAGYTGQTCAENINDCTSTSCNGHGVCKDRVNGFDCECFERYNGSQCENDRCPSQKDGIMTCPAAGCTPGLCSEHGLCHEGGQCSCAIGFNGQYCEIRKCNMSVTADVEIITPSLKDGSRLTCYTRGETIHPCHIRLYMAVKQSSTLNVYVNTTKDLENLISVDTVKKSSFIPGISNIYSADVTISGKMNSKKSHFVCATAGKSKSSSTCYELSFTANPEDDTTTLAYKQRNATVQFVGPTLKDHSRILCNTADRCHILLYTSFSSNRTACSVSTARSVVSSGRCDANDKDNDEGDPNTAAKSSDPCCLDVISSTPGVAVYPAHPRGSSCVSEASFTFQHAGETDICFHSANENFQQLCYKVDVFDTLSDPCSSSPCQNNGHCFHTDQNNYTCLCPDNYTGDKCERGPCQPADDRCQNGAYCQTNDGVATCFCPAGFSGPTCNEGPSSWNKTYAEFTDTAKPTLFRCVLYQPCSAALILTGHPDHKPTVLPGYIHPSLLLDKMEIVDRLPIQGSYQLNLKLRPWELGLKDLCIQTKDMNGINKDELCFKVDVISDVISIYGFQDRPHFVEPSLPANTEIECLAGEPCHVLYHVTPGEGNENECVTFHIKELSGKFDYHLFSSCATCNVGSPGNGNCTLDFSLVSNISDIDVQRHFCLSLVLTGSKIEGEERCFNLTVKDPSVIGKKGCQTLECLNGGFCDGHVPNQPACFCRKGFSGIDCWKAEVDSTHLCSQTQTFIGDLALPSMVKCVVNMPCYLPFQIVTQPGYKPNVSLGYVDPRIPVQTPLISASGTSGTIFEGKVVADPKQVGVFKVCIQTSVSSKIEDESCVSVDVRSSAYNKIDKAQPFFLPPTLTSESTVLCEVNKTCHINMHFTKGDNFGYPGKCPTLREVSLPLLKGVYIFNAHYDATDCISDVSYIPKTDGRQRLCLQVALPGKKGEIVCYTVTVVNDMQREVVSPCQGFICENGGKCTADFRNISPSASCTCRSGFDGSHCATVVSNVTHLPGIENLNASLHGRQYFDINSAIPREVKCEVNQDCCINTPYHGEKDTPPTTGYVDSNLTVTNKSVLMMNSGDTTPYILQTCVDGSTGGPYRMCLQTTTAGFKNGINVDEVCFNITIEPESKNHSTSGTNFGKTLPDGSTVLCKPNSTCHITIFTTRQSNGACLQVSECGEGVHGVHVFQTSLVGDICMTDVAVKTGYSKPLHLCISSGGEGRHLTIDVENATSFGPCQKLHCLNNGTCIAQDLSTAICRCPLDYIGALCETEICTAKKENRVEDLIMEETAAMRDLIVAINTLTQSVNSLKERFEKFSNGSHSSSHF